MAGDAPEGGGFKFVTPHAYRRIKRARQRSGTGLGLPKGRGHEGAATTNTGVHRRGKPMR